jgi:hypothetical protein
MCLVQSPESTTKVPNVTDPAVVFLTKKVALKCRVVVECRKATDSSGYVWPLLASLSKTYATDNMLLVEFLKCTT